MRIIVWGAGKIGRLCRQYIEQITNDEFIGFVDNNYQLGGVKPSDLEKIDFDLLIVSNQYEEDRLDIKKQLEDIEIDKKKVVFLYEDEELKNNVLSSVNSYDENTDRRVVWLASFANYAEKNKMRGSVAECGVYRGEFSYYINKYFPSRKCYLMDTFEGFPEKDLESERAMGEENFLKGKFNSRLTFNTANIDIVKSRMPNLKNCEFCVGYFPDSAKNIDDEFCFVNLDTDLYKPILAGLEFFYPKMVDNGVILIHDYFNDELPGVEKAVAEFEEKHGRLHKFPIADYCSLAIVK